MTINFMPIIQVTSIVMRINSKSLYSFLIGVAVAGFMSFLFLSDQKNNRKNGVLKQSGKFKKLARKGHVPHSDIHDCFI